jgi:uncharacterized protein (DUF58 family)
VRRRLPPLPEVPPRFPLAFRALLHELLARGPRLAGAAVEPRRARRSAPRDAGTFVGHRPYVRGDDVRRIDWAAYARSGELYVKQLAAEDRRSATVLIDLSPRMLVGAPPRRLAALRLAAVIGGLALRHLDGLTVLAPGAGTARVTTFAGSADLERLLQHLDHLPVAAAEPADAIALLVSRGTAGRVHWLSDFVAPAACQRALAALRRRGGRAIGWLPALPEDTAAPVRGHVCLADPATGATLDVAIDRVVAAAMQQQLDLLRRRQDVAFAQVGCPLVRWPAPPADEHRLTDFEEVLAWCAR